MSEETIMITLKEYNRLKDDSLFLECLNEGGVDNWDWYSEAWESFYKKKGNEK